MAATASNGIKTNASTSVPTKDLVYGTMIKVKTTLGQVVEGMVYTFDRTAKIVVLDQVDKVEHNFSLIPWDAVTECTILQGGNGQRMPSFAPVDSSAIDNKEEKAIAARKLEASRVGQGVSEKAQALFDALVKTMPCRWEKEAIVVMDDVRVLPPYEPANCSGQNEESLQRIKKMLTEIRKRLKI